MTRILLWGVILSVVCVGSVRGASTTDMNEELGVCLREVSATYGVNPYVLAAIIEVESGWRPWAISYEDATGWHALYPKTYDAAVERIEEFWARGIRFGTGLGQISAVHLRELQVEDPTILLDPCINMHWASYVLQLKMRTFGNTWRAIERYNGINALYPGKIQAMLRKFEVW